MPAPLAAKDPAPSATLRSMVGKSSAVQIYITAYAAAAPPLPITAKATVIHCISARQQIYACN